MSGDDAQQFVELLAMAVGALWGVVAADEQFKALVTLLTDIFIEGHDALRSGVLRVRILHRTRRLPIALRIPRIRRVKMSHRP
jgi:hypothetical protein